MDMNSSKRKHKIIQWLRFNVFWTYSLFAMVAIYLVYFILSKNEILYIDFDKKIDLIVNAGLTLVGLNVAILTFIFSKDFSSSVYKNKQFTILLYTIVLSVAYGILSFLVYLIVDAYILSTILVLGLLVNLVISVVYLFILIQNQIKKAASNIK